ncbi:PREDICTED: uncharacterized protein LOC109588352 isoform X3 [Amphimedon queenslandica]|uniref:Zinc finger PHD-type domain-containing protein n=1 Tax=Amphimedon queenslandica TaxID=400682 RepID=A0AAN0JT59_AMPQE|nr:PREDICTED: uncharacterized protein LOC109588352 isoform X3 [Amphimedon queenslandica]|eukprot:XP_019860084.1 PREDICTED: uncharacterized protein LOC109588352 isoform X3 [Amphimedon queenslandica]
MELLKEEDGELKIIKNNVTITNFTLKVTCAVNVPRSTSGYVYHIKTSYGDEGSCFINNNDSLSLATFTKKASSVVPSLQFVKTRCSDEIWGQYIFEACKLYRASTDCRKKTMVTSIGKQEGHDIWVLAPNVHIDSKGNIVPEDQHQFYWDEQTHFDFCKINLPLDTMALWELLNCVEVAMPDNFMSTYLTITSSVLVGHFETVIRQFGECPIPLLCSKTTGNGKSSSAQMALSCWGAQEIHMKGSKSTLSAIISCAAGTTIPIVVDDVSNSHAMEEIAVQFTGGATYMTVSAGATKPRTSIIATSNQYFADTDRNAVRLIHIPFWGITVDESQNRNAVEEALQIACKKASGCVGLLISMGALLEKNQFLEKFHEYVMFVKEQLPKLSYRVHRSYALLLTITDEICNELPFEIVTVDEVKSFFIHKWAPTVNDIFLAKACQLDEILEDIFTQVADMEIWEILRFLRPAVANKISGAKSMYICLPKMREFVTVNESKLKKELTAVGGKTGASIPFLNDTAISCSVTTINGKQRKCCQIPHASISHGILKKFVNLDERSKETANESEIARVSQSAVQENDERSKETANESETARVSQSAVQENGERSKETTNESEIARVSQSVVQENGERSKETTNESEIARVSQSAVQENGERSKETTNESEIARVSQSAVQENGERSKETANESKTARVHVSQSAVQENDERSKETANESETARVSQSAVQENGERSKETANESKTARVHVSQSAVQENDERSKETANESETARVSQSAVQENDERSKGTANESETARVSQSVVQENETGEGKKLNTAGSKRTLNKSGHFDGHGDKRPLISTNAACNALVKPVKVTRTRQSSKEMTPLDTCPKDICLMRRNNPNSTWVLCEKCPQWVHIRCAGITKHKASKEGFKYFCPKCKH